VTGSGSAVVEELFPGTEHAMTTVYHLDGSDLVLTHYCMTGNQPRMRAKASNGTKIAFAFDGGTNIDPKTSQHMHEATFDFVGKDELRSTFDDAILKYPDYYSLHRAMLRILMPRWHGSYEEVDDFIADMLNIWSADRRSEVYARLYSLYADLEGDDTDVFKDAYASWSQVREGYEQMLSRNPRSESLRNLYAAFACRAGDAETYVAARSQMRRVVQSAWTKKFSPEACDLRLDKSKDPSQAGPARAAGSDKTLQRTQW
jgi:hypothetical protein